ncbi:MAG: Flp family type IVb pilin [Myxococcota bacterium]
MSHSPLAEFVADERGGTAIEYGLIISLIFLIIFSAVTLMASRVTTMWNSIATHLS